MANRSKDNPNIANAFFRAGEIETWGHGIQRIFQACAEAHAAKPQLQISGQDLWIEFPFAPAYLHSLQSVSAISVEGTEKWGEKWGEKTTTKRIRIAVVMRKNSKISTIELARLLGMVPSAIDKHLKAMRENGSIARVGPARDGHWELQL